MAFRQIISKSVQYKLSLRALSNVQQSRNYADMSFTFASPVQVLYDKAKVKQVDVPSFSGAFGILPDHVPLLAVLKPGVVTVHEVEGAVKKYFVSSGSITINDDSSVQILAEELAKAEDIDIQAVREGAQKAALAVSSAQGEEAKAAAMIEQECYEELLKGVDVK